LKLPNTFDFNEGDLIEVKAHLGDMAPFLHYLEQEHALWVRDLSSPLVTEGIYKNVNFTLSDSELSRIYPFTVIVLPFEGHSVGEVVAARENSTSNSTGVSG